VLEFIEFVEGIFYLDIPVVLCYNCGGVENIKFIEGLINYGRELLEKLKWSVTFLRCAPQSPSELAEILTVDECTMSDEAFK
jgi:hypothetical protein